MHQHEIATGVHIRGNPPLHASDPAWRPLHERDLLPRFISGIQINSALCLAGCIVAGLSARNPYAWLPAIMAAGAAYLSYSCFAIGWPRRDGWFVAGQAIGALSIALGAGAVLALIL